MPIGPAMKDRIKYIAAYQVKPNSAITHLAEVAEIKPYKDAGKYVVVFRQPAASVGPIRPRDTKFSPQGPIYAQKDRLLTAKTLEDGLKEVPGSDLETGKQGNVGVGRGRYLSP